MGCNTSQDAKKVEDEDQSAKDKKKEENHVADNKGMIFRLFMIIDNRHNGDTPRTVSIAPRVANSLHPYY